MHAFTKKKGYVLLPCPHIPSTCKSYFMILTNHLFLRNIIYSIEDILGVIFVEFKIASI